MDSQGNINKLLGPTIKIIFILLLIFLIILGVRFIYDWYTFENRDISFYKQVEINSCRGIGVDPIEYSNNLEELAYLGINKEEFISFCECGIDYSIDNNFLTLEIFKDQDRLLDKTLSSSEKAQFEKTGLTAAIRKKVDEADSKLANKYYTGIDRGLDACMNKLR
jgi:hypothetical protein